MLPASAGVQPIELHTPDAATTPSEMTAPYASSRVSPAAPMPLAPADASTSTFLEAARRGFAAGRTGEALERAETRLLQRSAGLPGANPPMREPAFRDIGVARRALAVRDYQGALHAIDNALAASALAARPAPPASPGPAVATVATMPAVPTVTYALQAGHWQLQGAEYLWVPPETVPRPVQYRPLIQAHYAYVWRDGKWAWVPTHYGAD